MIIKKFENFLPKFHPNDEVLKLLENSNIIIRYMKNSGSLPQIDNSQNIIKILDDGSIDVFGSVDATMAKDIPIKFNRIWGDFFGPKSMKIPNNFPNIINGSFNLGDGLLETLVGGPSYVGDRFDIRNNKNLKNLDGCPDKIGEHFYCSGCSIESLEGGPSIIGNSGVTFGHLTSQFSYSCSHNNLKSLSGCPDVVGGEFDCSYNKLQNFEGGPKIVNHSYQFSINNIVDFVGFPSPESSYIKFIGYRASPLEQQITKIDNPVVEILGLIPDSPRISFNMFESEDRSRKIITFIYFLNEYNVIRNGDTIVADRLFESLSEVGVDHKKDLEFTNYRII